MSLLLSELFQPAVVGDRIRLPDAPASFVVDRCQLAPRGRLELACIPCAQRLANDCQLSAHLDTAPAQIHVIAVLCPAHGWEPL